MKTITRSKRTKAIVERAAKVFVEYFDCDLSDVTADCRVKETRILTTKRHGAAGCCFGKTIYIVPIPSGFFTDDDLERVSKALFNTVLHELVHIYQTKSGEFEGWEEVNDYYDKAIEIHARDAAGYISAAEGVKSGEITQEMFDKCFCKEMLTSERAKEKSLAKRK